VLLKKEKKIQAKDGMQRGLLLQHPNHMKNKEKVQKRGEDINQNPQEKKIREKRKIKA